DDLVGTHREGARAVPLAPDPAPRSPTLRAIDADEEARPLRPAVHLAPGEIAPYRPTQRPPMALLCILDDGSDEGEIVRLRADKYTLGRIEGDITIPHDALISARHAELFRHVDE